MLFLAIVLLGGISYARLPIDLLPDVSYPRLVIYTLYEEVAPAEVERRITEPIEGAAAAVPGVERVTSTSRYGLSLVTLRFAWGTDMDFAMLNVRERMDNVRESLPESVSRPTILRVDPESDPVMTLSVSGGEDLWQTKELSETVFRRRLEQLDGIAQAAVTGGLDREIRVEVEPRLLDSYSLTIEQISTALDRANVSAPGGTILHHAIRDLEGIAMDREVLRLRDMLSPRFAEIIYNGFWFSPEMDFIQAAFRQSEKLIDGQVHLRLIKGNVICRGRRSTSSLYDQELSSMDVAGGYDQEDAQGFIRLNALRLKAHKVILEQAAEE